MKSESALPATDNALHSELARANLARVRADFKSAEELCLALLRRYPNSDAAHTLMGDIYADQQLWDEASQWYELALDINPDSPQDRQKLDESRRHHQEAVEQQTDVQIGLPSQPPNVTLVAVSVAAIIFAFAFIAIMIGQKVMAGSAPPKVLEERINASPDSPAPATVVTPEPTTVAPVTPSSGSLSTEDRTIVDLLTKNSSEGSRVLSAERDPRSNLITITFSLHGEEDARRVAAQLGRDTLVQVPEALVITLRGLKEGHLVYMADVTKSRDTETTTSLGVPEDGPLSDAWVNGLLQREWPTKTLPSGTPTTPSASP